MIRGLQSEKESNTEKGKSLNRLFPELLYDFFLNTLKSSLFSLCCMRRTILDL